MHGVVRCPWHEQHLCRQRPPTPGGGEAEWLGAPVPPAAVAGHRDRGRRGGGGDCHRAAQTLGDRRPRRGTTAREGVPALCLGRRPHHPLLLPGCAWIPGAPGRGPERGPPHVHVQSQPLAERRAGWDGVDGRPRALGEKPICVWRSGREGSSLFRNTCVCRWAACGPWWVSGAL